MGNRLFHFWLAHIFRNEFSFEKLFLTVWTAWMSDTQKQTVKCPVTERMSIMSGSHSYSALSSLKLQNQHTRMYHQICGSLCFCQNNIQTSLKKKDFIFILVLMLNKLSCHTSWKTRHVTGLSYLRRDNKKMEIHGFIFKYFYVCTYIFLSFEDWTGMFWPLIYILGTANVSIVFPNQIFF